MSYETVAIFALTELLLSITPGPAVLLIVGLSMRQGFGTGFMASIGIVSTNIVFFTLSALGVGALIITSVTVFTILKWIGAAYLVYLGIGMISPLAKRLVQRGGTQSDKTIPNLHAQKSTAADISISKRMAFWKGFSLQASNPKNLAFFVAILPQFINTEGNLAIQMIALGAISVLLELPILVFYALASAYSARIMRKRVVDWIEATGGFILVCLGGALATSARSN